MTFAHKWRVAMICLTAGAGMIATALFVGIIGIVWLGQWSAAVEMARIALLAKGAIGMAILMGASMLGILVAGPLARIEAKFGEASVNVEGDNDPS